MKADITRSTFLSDKRFTGVRQQQGRVQLDSDWNEQVDIQMHRIETETVDLIGEAGGPIGGIGFEVQTAGSGFILGAGHYYVDGMLLENPAPVDLSAQPDFPGASAPTAMAAPFPAK